jgi:hypothetical protein
MESASPIAVVPLFLCYCDNWIVATFEKLRAIGIEIAAFDLPDFQWSNFPHVREHDREQFVGRELVKRQVIERFLIWHRMRPPIPSLDTKEATHGAFGGSTHIPGEPENKSFRFFTSFA